MASPVPRAQATEQRKQEILQAALACFVGVGYEKTTMEDIRRRANASTGSIYHHFKSKEQLAADLYLYGIQEVQDVAFEAMLQHPGAERGIRALVATYLQWVEDNRELATYLLNMRYAEFMPASEPVLERMNEEFRARVYAWVDGHILRGDLPNLPVDLYRAILIGPSDYFARQWLRGRTETDLKEGAGLLGDAAWAALQGLLKAQRGA